MPYVQDTPGFILTARYGVTTVRGFFLNQSEKQ